METKTFGERLLEYRTEHFLTQRQMAQLLGVSPNHIGVLEHGLKQPRASTEAAFARLTSKKQWEKFSEATPMNPEEEEACRTISEKLAAMEPEYRKEVLEVFLQILKLT